MFGLCNFKRYFREPDSNREIKATRFHHSVFKRLRSHITPFSNNLEPLSPRDPGTKTEVFPFHYSAFVRFHFVSSDISFVMFFGTKSVVVVVVAFSNDCSLCFK